MGRLSRPSLRKCRKFFRAIDGRLWIPAAVFAVGKWTAITEKMSPSGRGGSWGGHAQLPSNMLTPTRGSQIDVNAFTVQLNLHGDLDFFVRSETRGRGIERSLNEKTSVKDVIEACGVP